MRYLLLLGAVVAAAAGYVAYYFQVADGFAAGTEAWVRQARAEGVRAGYRALDIEGFPFRVVVRLTAPELGLPAGPPRPAWRAERLSLAVQPWNLKHMLLDLSGAGRLEADDGAARRRLDYRVASGRASYQADERGRLERFSADLETVDLDLAEGPKASLGRGQLHLRPAPDGGLDLALTLDRLVVEPESLPRQARPIPALGPEIRRVEADLGLEGVPPPGPDPKAWLAAWRDGGGDAQLRRFKLVWGKVDIEATGTLALDEFFRPIGALTARIEGHEHLVDAAVAAGQLRPQDAETAKALLGVLARSAGGVLKVPLTLQNGIVSLGPVALARLSPLL